MNYSPHVHPERHTLSAFALGNLSQDEANDIEVHIAECDTCCETLLNLEDDTFVDLLVRAKDVQIHPEETEAISRDSTSDKDFERGVDLLLQLSNHPRYRTAELLGRGGMGDVFKAEHRMMERTVALKAIKRELFRKPAAVERFHREVKSAAKLSHPNIVTAYDAEQAGDVTFLVMEYVEGFDLAQRVKTEGPLPVSEASDYVRQAALGLQHAHERGMVHRDIKPHNLMLSNDGTVKILDFGLATLAEQDISDDVLSNASNAMSGVGNTSRLTTLGTMMGTPDFISPEQATDPQSADIRSDIYSLGCTFYYLLTGRPPFTEGSALERIKAHSELEAKSVENVRHDVPPELAEILRRMMAKDPSERFQTPAEIADALAPFVDAHRTMPTQDRVADSGNAHKRSWWPPTIVQSVALAAFAFVLAGIIYITTDNGTLQVYAADDSVELIIRSVHNSNQGQQSTPEMRIVDTVTGTSAKRLPSGEYVLSLKGDENNFEIDKDHFVLKRGDNLIVRITHKGLGDAAKGGKRRAAEADLEGLGAVIRRQDGAVTQVFIMNTNPTVEQISLLGELSWSAKKKDDFPGAPYLAFVSTRLTDEHLARLKGLTRVATLSLSGSQEFTGKGLAGVAAMPSLDRLILVGADISNEDLSHLTGLTRLRSLDLMSNPKITDTGLEHLRGLTKLTRLWLRNTNITDAGLEHLSQMKNLQSLNFGFTQVTDAGLERLQQMFPAVTSLSLSGTGVTDAGLAHLRDQKQLQDLRLGGTKISDAGIEHLQDFPSIKQLRLGETNFTDQGLRLLKVHRNLETLDISGTKVSAKGLDHLRDMKKLKTLDVTETNLGEDAIAKLKEALPDCKIITSRQHKLRP